MTSAPSFDAIFAVMSAASVGDLAARVPVHPTPQLHDTPTKFAIALNVLLDDLAARDADSRREVAERGRLANRLLVLANASREFSEATDALDHLLDVVARRLGELVGDMCVVRPVSDDGEWLEFSGGVYHADSELLATTSELLSSGRQRVGVGFAGGVAATGQARLVPRTDADAFAASTEPRYRPLIERLGVSSAMALPLLCRGKVVGVAVLLRSGPDRAYTGDDLQLVQSMADHAALALGNARSYAAERAARDRADQAAKAVREAQARFDRLSESGVIGIVVVSELGPDMRVLEINDALLGMLGYSRDEILSGRVPWVSLSPGEWDHVNAHAAEQLTRTGIAGLREKEYIRKDGRRVPVLIGSATIGGGSEQIVSFVLDLTERNEARAANERLAVERAADAESRRLAAIVESSDDAIIGKTLEGVITSWNRGAARIFGYEADEVVGKSILVLIPPGRESEEPVILDALAHGEVRRFDTQRRRKDGRLIDVAVTSSPVRDASGRIVGIAKVARDITENKRAEAALARAKDAAEAASRELEAFSYSVAHDLRAPLRGMNGFARMLVDSYAGKLDADAQDWLQEIALNATKMGGLIDALLALARVTRSGISVEHVELSALVREVAAQLRASEPERGTVVDVQDGVWADADCRLARALLDNLLGNAWKFTAKVPAGRITFGTTEREGRSAFFVRDNGAGFDMAFAHKLFGPFQRLHTADEFPGTGIGLATVQRIVHRHGGRVWAESAVDAGATFYFTLPARATEVLP